MPADAAERARRLRDRVTAIGLEALAFTPPAKVEGVLRRWRPSGGLESDKAAIAVALATDLVMFAPSASGKTALDRLLHSRRPASADEAAAIAALRRLRFRLLTIHDVEAPGVLRVADLATGESLRLFDDDIPSAAVGVSITARLVPTGFADGHVVFGPIAPLDAAGRAVAMGFVRPGPRGLSNSHRCAEAVYRHVVRHGGPWPSLEIEGFPYGPEDTALDAIAHAWAGLPPEAEPPPDSLAAARSLADLDTVIDALATAVLAREHQRADLAEAYARVAAVQMETLQRRATSGFGGDTPTLDTVAAVIGQAIAAGELPPTVRALFDALRRRVRVAPAGGGDAALDRLVQRIQALRAKTVEQGCTEQEALAAAAKVGELLDRYGLSLSEIDLRRQACEGIGIETGRRRTGPIDDCVPTIAVFSDCRSWSERTADGAIRHVFFGLPADVEAAHYLYDLIAATFATETAAFKGSAVYGGLDSGGRRSATNSFQVGLARGIADKLMDMHRAREDAMVRATGRDLVPIKTAVVADELDKLGLSFTVKRPGRRRVLADAYHAGQDAGRRFDYRPALKAGAGRRARR
jgi:hypothetical protein